MVKEWLRDNKPGVGALAPRLGPLVHLAICRITHRQTQVVAGRMGASVKAFGMRNISGRVCAA
eukprot:5567632-Prorocentrum_lima.AAC.1